MKVQYSENLIIDLQVTNECAIDVVTPTSTIPDLTYNISKDGLITYTPTWTNSVKACPSTHEIRLVLADLSEVALTAKETSVLRFDIKDGSLDLQSSDKTLNGQVWIIKLFKRSTHGTQPTMDGVYLFKLEFIDLDSSVSPYSIPIWEIVLKDKVIDIR